LKKLLSGNEAFALGAYHAGVQVAASYPGTPSTEILESFAKFDDAYAEWSTNEKVAMEVGMGASYAGVRSLVSFKHVGFNVASDAFMAVAITGVDGGLVVISAGDPGIHSSQNEQDNRYLARIAKVPLLEPSDSQEAYELVYRSFDISEKFDTPVMILSSTRVSHSKSVVDITHPRKTTKTKSVFKHNVPKYVNLPVYCRTRSITVDERMKELAGFSNSFEFNEFIRCSREIGIISSGVAFQYARDVFPDASFLKLGMPFPLPEDSIKKFAGFVKKIFVVEELDSFIEDSISALGISVIGKKYIPRYGELNTSIIENAAVNAGLIKSKANGKPKYVVPELPARPPLFCPGCPHTGVAFILHTMGQRSKILDSKGLGIKESNMIVTGDIGCYTLAALSPFQTIDTTACMGASIGKAMGLEKAGNESKIVALIGDSTFLHSGVPELINARYNNSEITVLILDNGTTAMTGHQEHPGTGKNVKGEDANAINIEKLVKSLGINDVSVVNAFDIKELRSTIRNAVESPNLSVIIVRGSCAMQVKEKSAPLVIDEELCDNCGVCVKLGCNAIRKDGERVYIDSLMCMGDNCTICMQICPHKAIKKSD
jgi:indolepyruvate ferredoxin oxidoreductase, alpha subunit